MERTLVLVKPDGVQRGLIGQIISRVENRGLKIVALKLMEISRDIAYSHYEAHTDKPFFSSLVQFIRSGPVVAMVAQGNNAIGLIRNCMGETDPARAAPGTIRGDLAIDIGRNVIHGSDSIQAAKREIDLFFSAEDIIDYHREIEPSITAS